MIRHDINAIRSLGALLIAIFHIWIGGVSGGVDIFFVFTGYFLTKKTIDAYKKDGQLNLRSQKKFLISTTPEVLVVLIVILILGLLLQHPQVFEGFLREYLASVLYLENYELIRKRQDYLGRDSVNSLVVHFWAVSLILQVYLIWPLISYLSLLKSKLIIDSPFEKDFKNLLGLILVVSFTWSIFKTQSQPEVAYFDLTTRIWEFCAGGLAVFWGNSREKSTINSNILSWLAIALILTCGIVIGATQNFPGYASLWPVIGALLIIFFGNESSSGNASYWLARTPLVKLSSITFGFYLWHWPVYVTAKKLNFFSIGSPLLLNGLLVIILSVILAFSSRHLISKLIISIPSSHTPLKTKTRGLIILSVMFVLIFSLAGSLLYAIKNHAYIIEQNEIAKKLWNPWELTPTPFYVKKDRYPKKCSQNSSNSELLVCSYGDDRSLNTILLVGGSHSEHWLPALEEIAKTTSIKIISMTKGN